MQKVDTKSSGKTGSCVVTGRSVGNMAEREECNKNVDEEREEAEKSKADETDDNDVTEDGEDTEENEDFEDLDLENEDDEKKIDIIINNSYCDVSDEDNDTEDFEETDENEDYEDLDSENEDNTQKLDMMHQTSGINVRRWRQAAGFPNNYIDDQEDTKEIKECEDSESESEDDGKKHHASCMSKAAMENAYFICHNVQVSVFEDSFFSFSRYNFSSSGSAVFSRLPRYNQITQKKEEEE